MEVTVLRAEGAVSDPDSILSIRAGSSRRQGSVQIDKKLYFPVNFYDSPQFKIDLIKQVGSGEANITAENNEYAVPIEPRNSSEEKPPMLLNLKVAGKPLLCGRRSEPPKSQASDATVLPADLADGLAGVEDSQLGSAAQARRYFDDHNIMNLMKALLEGLIREQPENPYEYIAVFMDRLTGVKIPDPKSAPLSPRDKLIDGVARSTCPRWVKAFDAQDTRNTGTLDVDAFCEAIMSLHPMVSAGQAMALAGGVALGGRGVSLAAFCAAAEAVAGGEPQAAELAGLTVQAYQMLGKQHTATVLHSQEAIRLRDLLCDALHSGRLAESLSRRQGEQMREQVTRSLSQAAFTGQLAEALFNLGPASASPSPSEEEDRANWADLRSKAKAALMASVIDEKVLRPPAPTRATTQMVGTHFNLDEEYEPSEVLARAKAVLETDSSARDDKAGEDEFVYSQAELRAKARAALLATTLCDDEVPPPPMGTPADNEQYVENEDQAEYVSADLRAKAKVALSAAFANEAQAKQPQSLPLLAFNTIITAGLNGKLESAFAEIARQRGLPTLSAAPVTAESSTTQISSASEEQAATEKPKVSLYTSTPRQVPVKAAAPKEEMSPLPSIKAAAMSSASIKTTTASSAEVAGDAKPTVPKVNFNSEGTTGSARAAPPATSSEATPLSPRHSQLLERQRQLRDQQCSMQEHLKRLREMQARGSDSLQPAAPKAPPGGPTGRRAVFGGSQSSASSGMTQVSAFRELREANASLGDENRRLNEELARLMERSNNL